MVKSTATSAKSDGKAIGGVIQHRELIPGAEDRLDFIVTAACYRAKEREFRTSRELEDWLEDEVGIEEQVKH
jgi:hypothetical protein